jgi:hypothetical protein
MATRDRLDTPRRQILVDGVIDGDQEFDESGNRLWRTQFGQSPDDAGA